MWTGGGKCYFRGSAWWVLIRAKGQAAANVSAVSGCSDFNPPGSPDIYRSRAWKDSPFVSSNAALQAGVFFWHACSKMQGVVRSPHSWAPRPFISRLFNQLPVTKHGPSPPLMLVTRRPLSIQPTLLLALNYLEAIIEFGSKLCMFALILHALPNLWAQGEAAKAKKSGLTIQMQRWPRQMLDVFSPPAHNDFLAIHWNWV